MASSRTIVVNNASKVEWDVLNLQLSISFDEEDQRGAPAVSVF